MHNSFHETAYSLLVIESSLLSYNVIECFEVTNSFG